MIIQYFGGKTKGAKYIIPYLPRGKEWLHIEPFIGGMSIPLAHQPINAIFNDLNKELINLWTAVTFYKAEFEALIKTMPIHQDFYYLKGKFSDWDRDIANEGFTTTNIMRAALYTIKNRMMFSGVAKRKNPVNILVNSSFNMNFVPFRKKKWYFWNKGFEEFFEIVSKYDSYKRYYYLDPPYVKLGKAYLYSFTEQMHRKLAEILYNIDDLWVLSYDDHPLIRELYSKYYIKKVSWAYGISAKKQNTVYELLISNKPFIHRNQTGCLDEFL